MCVLECVGSGLGGAHTPSLSPALLLQLTFNGIRFKSLWIIPVGLWFVGHWAIMVCSWSVWEKMYACVFVSGCVSECLLVGEGEQGVETLPACLVGASQCPSSHCRRWTQSEPSHPIRLDPQIPSSGQQRDYGRNRLIYLGEFTYVKCLPRKLWHQPYFREQKLFKYLFFLLILSSEAAMLSVQSRERKHCITSLRALSSSFGILEKEHWACKGPPAITNDSPVCRKHPKAALWLIFVLIYSFFACAWGCVWNIAGGVVRWKIYCEGLSSQLYLVAHTRNETFTSEWYFWPAQHKHLWSLFFQFISGCHVFICQWGGSEVTVSEGDWITMNLSPCFGRTDHVYGPTKAGSLWLVWMFLSWWCDTAYPRLI